MGNEAGNLAAAEQLYALCAAGDWAQVREMLTDDFFVTEAPGLPYEGVFRGRDALQQLYMRVMATLEVAGLDVIQMMAGGDWVTVLVEMKARDADGAFRVPLAEAMRLRDGKVCEIKPYYFDPALVHRAAAAKTALV